MVDIVATYGAVPDGQKATVILTTNGTGNKTLTSTTPLWAVGDVGKKIAIYGAASVDGQHVLPVHITTIAGYTSTTVVTLTDSPPVPITGLSTSVEWGTDNNTAFSAFHTAQVGNSNVVLTIPAGRYCFGGLSNSNGFMFGIPSITVTATGGAAILSDMLGGANGVWLGGTGFGQFNDTDHSARTDTVSAGATTLVLKDSALASLFPNPGWALMTGLAIQYDGFPSNAQFYEYVYITGISGSTLTLQTPLRNSYKDTWPTYTPGGSVDFGGPATLYALNLAGGWDCVHVYNGLTVETSYTVVNCGGKDITLNSCTFPIFGPNISVCKDVTLNNVSIAVAWEVDKLTENVTITGDTIRQLNIQSACPYTITINDVDFGTGLNGTPTNTILNNCTFPSGSDGSCSVGPHSFGVAEEFTATNCDFSGGFILGGVKETNITTTGAYTMTDGVISRLKDGGTGGPPQWAVPGAYVIWGGHQLSNEFIFQVLDMWEDSTHIYIQTNLSGSFPLGSIAQTHPSPKFTLRDCYGSEAAEAWSLAPARWPQHSYWKYTYTGDIGTGHSTIPMIGELVSCKVNVITPYGGSNSPFLTFDGPYVIVSDRSKQFWTPSFNLKQGGERVITLAGVTGTKTGDQFLAVPDSDLTWLVNDQITPKVFTSMADDLATSVSIEIITDQGIPLPSTAEALINAFRLRLH